MHSLSHFSSKVNPMVEQTANPLRAQLLRHLSYTKTTKEQVLAVTLMVRASSESM